MTVSVPAKPAKRYRAVILVMLACSILCALGTWQLKRLAWKQELIATLEHRLAEPASDLVSLPPPVTAHEWRRVTVQGHFAPHSDIRVGPRTRNGQVGVHVFSVFVTTDGQRVVINRGFVAQDNVVQAASQNSITGVLRVAAQSRFTPDNHPASNAWYWPDVNAMLGGDGVADIYIQLLPDGGMAQGKDMPQALDAVPHLPNNHAQYAAFWFGMAGLCVLIFVLARKKGYA